MWYCIWSLHSEWMSSDQEWWCSLSICTYRSLGRGIREAVFHCYTQRLSSLQSGCSALLCPQQLGPSAGHDLAIWGATWTWVAWVRVAWLMVATLPFFQTCLYGCSAAIRPHITSFCQTTGTRRTHLLVCSDWHSGLWHAAHARHLRHRYRYLMSEIQLCPQFAVGRSRLGYGSPVFTWWRSASQCGQESCALHAVTSWVLYLRFK